MSIVSIRVPQSQIITSNNERGHWAKRSGVKKRFRTMAHYQARSVKLQKYDQLIRVIVRIDYPDNKQRDSVNLYPTVKCHVDGFVDYGLIPDDNDKYLVGPDFRATGKIVPGFYVFHYEVHDASTM